MTSVELFNFFMNIKGSLFYTKKNSPKDLAKGFIELYDDPALCKLIGENGKRYAKNNYSSSYLGKKVMTKISTK